MSVPTAHKVWSGPSTATLIDVGGGHLIPLELVEDAQHDLLGLVREKMARDMADADEERAAQWSTHIYLCPFPVGLC